MSPGAKAGAKPAAKPGATSGARVSLIVVGATGRMGRAILETAAADPGFHIKARVVRERAVAWAEPGDETDDLAAVLGSGDVVVEFTRAGVAGAVATVCAEHGAALVSGTTGLGAAEEAQVVAAAGRVAVLRAANFSRGVWVLERALRTALAGVPGWDVEIVERHHRDKIDSPSGTAMQLARHVAEVRGLDVHRALRHGREGRVGPRGADEIGIHAVRGGSWTGDHLVLLSGWGEWVELRHVAQDRGAFARGSLDAARFVATASAGLYTFGDAMGAASR